MSHAGAFVMSLDFELMWGVRDKRTIDDYGANVLGVRTAVPRLLEAFARYDIACTWATVGMLFFEDKDALLAGMPDRRPAYDNKRFSPYEALAEVGPTEKADPYHFGLSMIKQIIAAPRQEIGTHTFSHYYCLEDGGTTEDFEADLQAAHAAARNAGVKLKSIVFPRTQYSSESLAACKRAGLIAYRGNETHAMYRPVSQRELTPLRRLAKLADSYIDLSGANASAPRAEEGLIDIPASRFLRPWNASDRFFKAARSHRIISAMRQSAREKSVFHLWFHPHNFGINQEENFAVLDRVLAEFARLRDAFGWPSLTMAEVADGAAAESAHG